jgi:hypothetical protein
VDNIAATGRDESDEEQEETYANEGGALIVEVEDDEEDPQDTEGRHMSEARLRDAAEEDERGGYWDSLLERATVRSQWLRGGMESEDGMVDDDAFTWREGDELWEIGCRVRVQISSLFTVLIEILDRT